jgi:hypothetical protein
MAFFISSGVNKISVRSFSFDEWKKESISSTAFSG